MSKYKSVLGIEVHAQIATKTKLFSRSLNTDEAQPNEQVDYLDAGLPGTLPIANKQAIEMALKTSLALNMKINDISIFDRKHYFYQDLPLGYQITQFYQPIGVNGYLECSFGKVRINRLHIEADAGKSVYEGDSTLVDLNRAGVPLMEIVTEPDFKSALEVVEFMKELRGLLLVLGTCKCDMECGNLRADVNLSLHEEGTPFGNRVEIKNLNSFRFITKAVEYEAGVQEKTLESGEKVRQETKLFDSKLCITKARREKEDAVDYRYFPDPDLLPIKLDLDYIEQVRASLPRLPQEIRKEYDTYGIGFKQGYSLTEHPLRIAFFERIIDCLKANATDKVDTNALILSASNWVCSELIGKLGRSDIDFEEFIVSREDFVPEFAKLVVRCEVEGLSRSNAKDILDMLIEGATDVDAVIEKNGYLQKIDSSEIQAIVDSVIANSPAEVAKYKAGKVQLLMFFVGNVMKETKGKADPEMLKTMIASALEKA